MACAVSVIMLGSLPIAFAADATAPTFNKEIAPILFKRCANCHRPGQIAGDISFLSYDSTRHWAESIKEKVLKREMPPWTADPNGSVKFRNDPRLSQEEIDALVTWVNAGAPKGNDAEQQPAPTFAEGWLHPKGLAPDAVVTLPQIEVRAPGQIPYVRFLVKVPFSTDKWIDAIQVLPGNPALVHHMAFAEWELNDGVTPAVLDSLTAIARQLGFPSSAIAGRPAVAAPGNVEVYDMLGVYTPGTTFEMYEDGSAKLLKGGNNFYLNCNLHYQFRGRPEKDRTKIAFWFQQELPKHQIFRVPASGENLIANGQQLLTDTPGEKAEGTGVVIPPIPPYTENYEVIGITAYTEPVTIYQFQPHAHLRGKNFTYAVVYPDGREQSVLRVPKYDFHWQLAYDLETPLKLPAGSKLVITAHYDNSLKNEALLHHHGQEDSNPSHNPGPDKEVYFRAQNQSWDEMFSPFIQYSIDSEDLTKPAQTVQPQQGMSGKTNAAQPGGKRKGGGLDIVEVVGCLEQSASGVWLLTHSSDPVVSKTQSTSMAELKQEVVKPLGKQQYQLLGVSIFNPSGHKEEKMAVKGVLIHDANVSRINVTSQQTIASTCN
jgi:mono/diheme cytochrome c family protein